MPYKNIKEVLVAATQYPAAIEAALPAGAPVISTMLVDAAGKIPTVPDFPMEIPDLPAPPTLPAPPGGTAARARATTTYVREAQVTVVPQVVVAPVPRANRYLF